MTTYIFAIGGTGARVLRSLTMLLAAGCEGTSNSDEIVPIIIDYDTTNADTERAQKVLEQYKSLHKAIYETGDSYKEHFFCTPVTKIKEKVTLGPFGGGLTFEPRSRFEIHLDQTDTDITFGEFLKLNSMSVANNTLPTRHLLEALYDNSSENSPRAELNLNLNKGFKGCPNIGCIVTCRLEQSPEFQNFKSNFKDGTDRILIIGSVFGGTGASGIPMLLDLIRENPSWQSVPVGVLAILPYFKVSEDTNSAISSQTFKAKAKAAMTAYDLNGSVNSQATAIYYVGDTDMNTPFANHEGGREQENKALFTELVAAMFAIDFITKNRAVWATRGNKAIPFEFGMTDDAPISTPTLDPVEGSVTEATAIKLRHFFANETKVPYIDPLARFVTFAKFSKEYLAAGRKTRNDTWLIGSRLESENNFKSALDKFADELFGWLDELAGPQRPLTFFRPNSPYYELYVDRVLERRGRLFGSTRAFDEDDIREALAKDFDSSTKEVKEKLEKRPTMMYIKNSNVAFREIYNKVETFNA